jgi:hypothetical protein
MRRFAAMFSSKKLNAVKPVDRALATADFRDQLIRLINEAEAHHVSLHVMVDTIEAQLTRVRIMINSATRPW